MFRTNSRRFAASIVIMLAAAGLFAVSGHFLASGLIGSQQRAQMEELAFLALRRSEAAIDHGARTLGALEARGALKCDPASLQAVRLDVYRGGAIKDIRILSPGGYVVCSAFSETLEFDVGAVTRDAMTPSQEGSLLLHPMELFFGNALGIRREFGDRGGISAILGISGPALDVLPESLRAHGDVILRMRDGRMIAHARGANGEVDEEILRETTRQSQRYPIDAVVQVEEATLAVWRQKLYAPIMAGATVLGLLFGFLLVRPAFRPATPLEELDRALAASEFVPYLQPIFDLKSGVVAGAEVLARQIREDGSVVSPARFIELAERSGRVRRLTWQIMEKALRQTAGLLDERRDFYLSFNVTPDHFVTDDFFSRLVRTVDAARIRPSQVGIEITERQGFENLVSARAMVDRLRARGFRVIIDDVGIGHSGLSQIQMLGAHTIKIDKFFVDSISLDSSSNIVVEMLVRLARDKGMTIIAEGIETEPQAAALAACGVSLGQGYLVARPMPWRDFDRMLRDGSLARRLQELSGRLDEAA